MRMKNKIFKPAALLLLTLLPQGAIQADDTDIYINQNPPPGSQPLVMFSIDYRPNLTSTVCTDVTAASCTAATFFRNNGLAASLPLLGPLTFFDILRLSLKLVLSQVSGINIGLMISHDDSSNSCKTGGPGTAAYNSLKCSNGGYIMQGFQPVVTGDTNGTIANFLSKLNAIPPPQGNLNHPYQGAELFFEFYRYLAGLGIYNGHDGWTDYGNTANKDLPDSFPAASWDTRIENTTGTPNTQYLSPFSSASACTKIFTVNFLFQVSNQDNNSNSAIAASIANGGMGFTPSNSNAFKDVVAYLHNNDLSPSITGTQSVTSYFIVDPTKINNTTTGYATAGGTNTPLSLSSDPQVLVNTLTDIFKQILSVSTTFTAASVPVNVFNRATVQNNVFIALFQADPNGKPYWPGDLKKLQLQTQTLADGSQVTTVVDANSNNAIAPDGRINYNALTFWTQPSSLPATDPYNGTTNVSANLDGRIVSRGGAGQIIPGFISATGKLLNSNSGARQLFYDSGATSIAALNADTTTATNLAANLTTTLSGPCSTPPTAQNLLQYMRGIDITCDTTQTPSIWTVNTSNPNYSAASNPYPARSWLMADPLHSRPLPINYGTTVTGYTTSNPAIYIAMGGNDGFLHFIRNTNTDGSQSGKEVWAFMPQKAMGIQPTLLINAPTTPMHPYGFDGAASVYTDTVNNKTYLYMGMRRGGNAYYALDVSNPESPPVLLWKIDASTTGFYELGLTFSTPRTVLLNYGNGIKPVVIFAGGYDINKDRHALGTPDTRGNAIYIVDAVSGALIWKATGGATTGSVSATQYTHTSLVDSIPSDITAVDTDGDGLADRILVGDTGGNVWRADLSAAPPLVTTNPANWKLTKLATLGYHDSNTRLSDRRFFSPPDFVQTTDENGVAYDAVVLGSGDREDPLDYGGLVNNFFYVLRDYNTGVSAGTNSAVNQTSPADITSDCLQTGTALSCGLNLQYGWKLALTAGLSPRDEKVLASAATFSNVVYFTTYIPPGSISGSTCGPAEGSGNLYAVSLQNGNAVIAYNSVGSNVALTAADRVSPLASGGIPAQVVFIPTGAGGLSYIRPDLRIDQPDTSNRFTTFWQHVEQ